MTRPSTTIPVAGATDARLLDIEDRYDRRIGLFARNLRTGRTLEHRADDSFVMCSTFKTLAVAAVLDLRLVSPDRCPLRRRAAWPPSLVAGAGYAPRFAAWQDAGYRPTVAEVCDAVLADSDNAAGNWLLQRIGGPDAITRLARDLGDEVSNLTRWEPALNGWEPGQQADTTTPRAIGTLYARLLTDDVLDRPSRERLTRWMLGNRTGDRDLRAGLPEGWTLADKTGTGEYGTRNDVGVAWTDRDVPVVISCLTSGPTEASPALNAPLADTARRCADLLG